MSNINYAVNTIYCEDQFYLAQSIVNKKTNRYIPIRELLDKNDIDLKQSYKKLAVFLYELYSTHKFTAIELTQDWLAHSLCYSRQTINRALQKLEQVGLIKIIRSEHWKTPHKYIFCAPAWLRKLIDKIPVRGNFYKFNSANRHELNTVSTNVTRSNTNINIYKNNNNNLDCLYTRTRSLDAEKINREKAIENMSTIKRLAGISLGNPPDPEKKPDDDNRAVTLPDLKTCTDPVLLRQTARKLIEQGKNRLAYDYTLRAHELQASPRARVRDDVAESNADYAPWGDPPLVAKQISNPAPKKVYKVPESLPNAMRQKLRRDTFMCLNRTLERDPAELCAQLEYAILQDMGTDDVKYANDPLELAYNRKLKLLKEGRWERPYGYVDLQTKMAKSLEDLHQKKKSQERAQFKTPGSVLNNLTQKLNKVTLPYSDK